VFTLSFKTLRFVENLEDNIGCSLKGTTLAETLKHLAFKLAVTHNEI